MKSPDYLFVRIKNNVLLYTSFAPTEGCTTYICKDTLLDWIKEQEKELDYGIAAHAYQLALDMLKEKLNSYDTRR